MEYLVGFAFVIVLIQMLGNIYLVTKFIEYKAKADIVDKAENAVEAVAAVSQQRAFDVQLEALKDAHEQDKKAAKDVAESFAPQIVNTDDGRQIDMNEYEVM